jgi:hypothetical protein
MLTSMDIPAAPVGADVHYRNAQGICRAAKVTAAQPDSEDDTVQGRRDLRILHAAEIGDRIAVPFGPHGEKQTWHRFDASTEPGCQYLP